MDRGGSAAVAVEDNGRPSAAGDSKLLSFLPTIDFMMRNKQIVNDMASVTKAGMKKGDAANIAHAIPLDPPVR